VASAERNLSRGDALNAWKEISFSSGRDERGLQNDAESDHEIKELDLGRQVKVGSQKLMRSKWGGLFSRGKWQDIKEGKKKLVRGPTKT